MQKTKIPRTLGGTWGDIEWDYLHYVNYVHYVNYMHYLPPILAPVLAPEKVLWKWALIIKEVARRNTGRFF